MSGAVRVRAVITLDARAIMTMPPFMQNVLNTLICYTNSLHHATPVR